jgi:hypothetical protein
MVSQKMQRSCFIRLCALILASFRLDNGMIAHAIGFDLDISSPSEVVPAAHSKHFELPLCDVPMLTVKIRQPSHEFTFGVGISFIPYPLVLTPVV